jgi:hypothetical protein
MEKKHDKRREKKHGRNALFVAELDGEIFARNENRLTEELQAFTPRP